MESIIWESPAMQDILRSITKIGACDTPVVIEGEKGTGKEWIARCIHNNSRRNKNPFVAIDCTTIPRNYMENIIFGQEKDFSNNSISQRRGKIEYADGGTLFLDGVEEINPESQTRLLSIIERKCMVRVGGEESVDVDLRIIAGVSKDLKKLTKENEFREDLYYRLNIISMQIPSLRERKEDIPVLVDYFIKKYSNDYKKKEIAVDVMNMLMRYPWYGNIRELENVIQSAVVMSTSDTIQICDLPGHIREHSVMTNMESLLEGFIEAKIKEITSDRKECLEGRLYHTLLSLLERPILKSILRNTRGNQLLASRILGINRNTLRKKIKELKISGI